MSRKLWVRENWEEYVKEEEERERIRHAESGNTRKSSNKMVFILTPPFTFDTLGNNQTYIINDSFDTIYPKINLFSHKNSNLHNICPNCQETPHDPNNIFNCNSKPTHQTPSSLWDKLQDAASFLGLHEEEEEDI